MALSEKKYGIFYSFIMATIFLIYGFYFKGPAYLADEIGYLSKAAWFSGKIIDGASSYQAGYALLISPSFIAFSQPEYIWRGVLFINALLWFCNFILLHKFLLIFLPKSQVYDRLLALAFSTLYPAWLVMSSYAFPTTGIVFIFLCSLHAILNITKNNVLTILPYSLLVGGLCWMHPTGLAIACASIIVMGLYSIKEKNLVLFMVHGIAIIILIFIYKSFIHGWIDSSMTPTGYSFNNHYPSLISVISKFSSLDAWVILGIKVIGQVSYLVVSSFGVIVFGVYACFKYVVDIIRKPSFYECSSQSLLAAYLIFSIFFAVCIGSIGSPSRVDHWIYGRYNDPFILPLLAVGYCSLVVCRDFNKRIRVSAFIVLFLCISFYFLTAFVDAKSPNNLVNTPSFWPQYFFESIEFLKWGALSMAGVTIAIVGGKYCALGIMAVSFIIGGYWQTNWHLNILNGYSKPSSIVSIIRRNFNPGTCVGFDSKFPKKTSLYQRERFGLYRFYLFDYKYRRFKDVDEWRASCDGPLLTYNPQQFIESITERVFVRESASGLFMIVKDQKGAIDVPDEIRLIGDIMYAKTRKDPCLIAGCFSMRADQLAHFSKVGIVRDNRLSSDGRAGYLFYGPYRSLEKGRYKLIIRGNFSAAEGAIIDLAGNKGTQLYYKGKLCQSGCVAGEVVMPFELNEKVTDLEVRLTVSNADRVSISGYEIIFADD